MDNPIIIVIGFIAFIGVIWLWQKFTSAVGKKANQAIFQRKGHREGQDLVSRPLSFQSSASRNRVRQAIIEGVKVAANKPAVIADAYIVQSDEGSIVFDYGNRLQTQFRAMLILIDAEGGGTKGIWKVSDWMESDGIVTGQSVMKRLTADINTALRSVDSNAMLK